MSFIPARLVTGRIRRFRDEDRGSMLVEFAFVLPLLLVILFGVVAWGISMSMLNAMYDTARTCARSVAIGAVEVADVSTSPVCQVANWPVAFTVEGETVVGPPDLAEVTISTPNPVGFLAAILPMPDSLLASVAMPVEGAGP